MYMHVHTHKVNTHKCVCVYVHRVTFRIFVKGGAKAMIADLGGVRTIVVLWYFYAHICESEYPRNLSDI